jgi:hypothetical protein
MANETPMSDRYRGADYDDSHIDDPEEWDASSPEDVTPRPSGMTVLSLRLPTDEFVFLKREADARKTTMSELMRSALRFYLSPRASGSLSATAIHKLQVTTMTPTWVGGRVEPRAEVTYKPESLLGNADPQAAAKP